MAIAQRIGSQDPVVSFDIGYGHTKAKRGGEEIRFPSVTGPSRRLLQSGLEEKDPLQFLEDKKRETFVGDLALRQCSTKVFSLNDQKMDHAGTMSLFEAAAGYLCSSPGPEVIKVISGLPVTFYFDQKEKMEQLLKQRHSINVQAGSLHIEKRIMVSDVKVIPQPMGSVMDYLLDDRGQLQEKSKAAGSIGVLDIGFYTNDLLVLSGMEVMKDYSRSLRSGMSVALKALSDSGIDLPIYELDRRIRAGEYAAAAAKAHQALADQISGEVETYWPKLDTVIITGGAGEVLFDQLAEFIKRSGMAKEVRMIGQMGNIRGYQKIGRRTWP